jgi:hypothetical protein
VEGPNRTIWHRWLRSVTPPRFYKLKLDAHPSTQGLCPIMRQSWSPRATAKRRSWLWNQSLSFGPADSQLPIPQGTSAEPGRVGRRRGCVGDSVVTPLRTVTYIELCPPLPARFFLLVVLGLPCVSPVCYRRYTGVSPMGSAPHGRHTGNTLGKHRATTRQSQGKHLTLASFPGDRVDDETH